MHQCIDLYQCSKYGESTTSPVADTLLRQPPLNLTLILTLTLLTLTLLILTDTSNPNPSFCLVPAADPVRR